MEHYLARAVHQRGNNVFDLVQGLGMVKLHFDLALSFLVDPVCELLGSGIQVDVSGGYMKGNGELNLLRWGIAI